MYFFYLYERGEEGKIMNHGHVPNHHVTVIKQHHGGGHPGPIGNHQRPVVLQKNVFINRPEHGSRHEHSHRRHNDFGCGSNSYDMGYGYNPYDMGFNPCEPSYLGNYDNEMSERNGYNEGYADALQQSNNQLSNMLNTVMVFMMAIIAKFTNGNNLQCPEQTPEQGADNTSAQDNTTAPAPTTTPDTTPTATPDTTPAPAPAPATEQKNDNTPAPAEKQAAPEQPKTTPAPKPQKTKSAHPAQKTNKASDRCGGEHTPGFENIQGSCGNLKYLYPNTHTFGDMTAKTPNKDGSVTLHFKAPGYNTVVITVTKTEAKQLGIK